MLSTQKNYYEQALVYEKIGNEKEDKIIWQQAAEYYQKAIKAHQHIGDACFRLAMMRQDQRVITTSAGPLDAAQLIRSAIKLNHLDAKYHYGLLLTISSRKEDIQQGKKYIEETANAGHVLALYNYASLIHQDCYPNKVWTDAIPLYQQIIAAKVPLTSYWPNATYQKTIAEAELVLAKLYLYGEGGLVKSENMAICLLTQSSKKGNIRAEFILAKIFLHKATDINSDASKQEQAKALGIKKLFNLVESHQLVDAQIELGIYFHDERKDVDNAEIYWRTAALKNSPLAAFLLAKLYESKRDLENAEIYFKLACEGDYVPAQLYYAQMLFNKPNKKPEDVVTAIRYIEKAADADDADAQYEYFLLLEKKREVTANETENNKLRLMGLQYLNRAAANKHPLAQFEAASGLVDNLYYRKNDTRKDVLQLAQLYLDELLQYEGNSYEGIKQVKIIAREMLKKIALETEQLSHFPDKVIMPSASESNVKRKKNQKKFQSKKTIIFQRKKHHNDQSLVTVNDVEKLPVSSELLDSKKWFLIQNSQVVGGCVVIDLPTSARDILEKLVKAGCQAYVVGGFARNILCGQLNPQDDIDIVTNASDSVIRNTLTEAKQNNKKPQLYVFTTDDRRIEIWRSPILSYTQEADARNRDFLPNTLFVDKTGKLFDPFKLVLQKDAEGIKINKELQIVPGKSFEDFPELLLRYTYFEASGLVASHEIEVMKQHITKLDTIPLAEREHLLCKHFMSGKANKSLDILIKYGFLQKLYPAIPVDNLIIMQWLKQELIMIDQRYKIGIPLAKRYIFGLLLLANLDVKVLTKDISLSFYARHLMQICHENDTSELLKYEATLRQLSRSHPVLCLVLSSERSSFAIQYQQSGVFRSTPLAQNANMSPKNEGSGGLSPVTAQIMNH